MSCIVLAGGKSLRLGRDKVRVNLGNNNLLQRVISKLSFLDTDIIIVTAKKEPVPDFVDYPKVKTVGDIYPGKGSLGGIYTGLAASDSFHNLVVACDMPFLNRALLCYMLQVAADFDLVVPRLGKRIEPLHAVYSQNCLAPIENLLKQGELQIFKFFPEVKVKYLEAGEIERFDPEHLSFFNINTEADLKKAVELTKREDTNHHDEC
jgi:molybdopterin-guanine dinucleotide biosynthesis protein A